MCFYLLSLMPINKCFHYGKRKVSTVHFHDWGMDRILNSVLYIKSLAKTKIKQKRMGGAPRVFFKKNKIKKKRQKEKKRMRKRGGGSLLLCGGLRCGLLGLPCRLPTLLLHREGLQLLSHVLGGVVLAGSCPRRGGTVRHCSCSHPPAPRFLPQHPVSPE